MELSSKFSCERTALIKSIYQENSLTIVSSYQVANDHDPYSTSRNLYQLKLSHFWLFVLVELEWIIIIFSIRFTLGILNQVTSIVFSHTILNATRLLFFYYDDNLKYWWRVIDYFIQTSGNFEIQYNNCENLYLLFSRPSCVCSMCVCVQ